MSNTEPVMTDIREARTVTVMESCSNWQIMAPVSPATNDFLIFFQIQKLFFCIIFSYFL